MSDLYNLYHTSAHELGKISDKSVQCIVTSPPYFGLRDYKGEQEVSWEETIYSPILGLPVVTIAPARCALGSETSINAYIGHLIVCAREWKRVLSNDGVLWVNIGDSYSTTEGGKNAGNKARVGNTKAGVQKRSTSSGLPIKNLCMIPQRFALAMQADGWILRSECIWQKPNAMPENVEDRPSRDHELIYMFSKQKRYFYNREAVRGSSNLRTVWKVALKTFKGAHFACFPPALVEPMIKAGSRVGDTVFDPFNGSGTTGRVAIALGRKYIGTDLSEVYLDELAPDRLTVQIGMDELDT